MIKGLFANNENSVNSNRLNKFIEDPKRALWTLSWPIIFGLLFQALYLIVDTFFVIRVGHDAVAAVTFAVPVFLIIIASVVGFGIGVTALISKYIGAKEKSKASDVAHHAVIVGIVLGGFVSLLGYIITPVIFPLLGAYNQALVLVVQYFRIIIIGSFFLVASVIFGSILAGEGNTKVPTTILIFAAIINLILDPIFIFIFNWGIKGAAWATFTSFVFSFVAYLVFLFIRDSSYFHFNFKKFNIDFYLIKKIFHLGSPVSISHMLLAFGTMFINYFVAGFGQKMVAGFGLASRIEVFYMIIIIGTSSGLLALISMYLGAKRHDLIKFIMKYAVKVNLMISLLVALLFYFFSGLFLSIFTHDRELINIGVTYFRIIVYSYPIIPLIYIIARLLQAAGHPKKDTLVNVFRLMIFFLPLIWLLVYVLNLGIKGIWYSRLIATVLAFILALFFYKKVIKEVKKAYE